MEPRIATAGALLLALWLQAACALPSLPAKCTACMAMAEVLSSRIQAEGPRNHLDMRGRLDSTGQRYGRQIEYKSSELRAVELLEGICTAVKRDYVLVFVESGGGEDGAPKTKTQHWAKIRGEGSIDTETRTKVKRQGKYEEEATVKRLEIFCGAVLEEYEEDFTQAIMAGKMDEGHDLLESHMCGRIAKLCPLKQRPPPAAQEGDGAAAEAAAAPAAQGGAGEMVIDEDAAEVADSEGITVDSSDLHIEL